MLERNCDLVDVKGELPHQSELLALVGGCMPTGEHRCVATLSIPEWKGRGKGSVAVELVPNCPAGFLMAADARAYREAVETATAAGRRLACHALMRGGLRYSKTEVGRVGVVVFLPSPEACMAALANAELPPRHRALLPILLLVLVTASVAWAILG